MKTNSQNLKAKVAREAATLLYFGAEKEYKQAKLRAAKTLNVHFLPKNLEVARELDAIADENEGPARKERLIQMRKEALEIMTVLKAYCPLLIGSVWRGTVRQGSDIDIAIYDSLPEEIPKILATQGFKISKTQWNTVTKKGKTEPSFHIYTETVHKHAVEVVVRSAEEACRDRKCEIFGDRIKGLNVQELSKILSEYPGQQFIPV